MLDIRCYGATPGGADCALALNAALADAQAGSDKTIWIPAGQWFLASKPDAVKNGIRLVGEGKSDTILTRNYSNDDFLVLVQNGSMIRDLTIWAGSGTSGGTAIHAIADNGANGPGGNHRIQDVWITSGSGATWAIPLFLDGLNRTIDPIGIRTVRMDNVTVFNATAWAVEWWNAISCEWIGGGAYQGAGITDHLAIGGPLGQKGVIIADINVSGSTIWPGALRASVI